MDITSAPSAYQVGHSGFFMHYTSPAYDRHDDIFQQTILAMVERDLGGPVPTAYSKLLGNYSQEMT